jgi:hypothetical protein
MYNFCIFLLFVVCSGKRVDFGYVPNGDNPTLYDAVNVSGMHAMTNIYTCSGNEKGSFNHTKL